MHPSPLRTRLLAGLGALLATAGLVAGSALPAAAETAHRHPIAYVALGDSYAAGQATDCTHTASSYPLRLDRLPRIRLVHDVTCAAATTADVAGTQLAALSPRTRLVTVTVGADDLDVAGLEAVCAPAPSSTDCLNAIRTREAELPQLGSRLVAAYGAIAAAAPHARILVTGYPTLVSSGPLATAESALNSTIQAAVTAARTAGAHIRFVPLDFTGHTVDSADPWFVLSGPNIFHPNCAGDRAIARAIAHAIHEWWED
ncbi:GDSL-type esterase/lipase family protein [Amnibacterium sp. CER49]|uniref:GDSL-type esterase/lipase family protein n=1 Tax=Amnibacterium sp. CER49 TaxID=3039161 RepID=UPI0024482DF8|nr:GDSL-type esterase/lipase family protein [Amnibacterium sp. CER49]MDH2445472.1 GDSL-type esterase/lipase family protein [Amnibacterium sp. CER49]